MRRSFVAGNWKMNLTRAQGVELASALARAADGAVEVAVCPPALYLEAVAAAVRGSQVGLGAQNCYHEAKGAFTGEISTAMLVDLGCRYVILGHSERRAIFGETNAGINKKVHAALAAGLIPIVCVGETAQQRQEGQTQAVVREQFEGSLAGLSTEQMGRLVIAYEPVWAIGTGLTATPADAQAVHADLRALLAQHHGPATAAAVRIQYGGSVTADNAAALLGQPDIDGALVGGASLKPESFLAIVAAGKR